MVDLFREQHDIVCRNHPVIDRRALIHETVRGMINCVVTDLVETSRRRLEAAKPLSIDDVREQPHALIQFSTQIAGQHRALKRYLHQSLYQHESVQRMTVRAHKVVKGLFERFMADPAAMPAEHADRAAQWQMDAGDGGRARAVADYVAGMTDRYALAAFDDQ